MTSGSKPAFPGTISEANERGVFYPKQFPGMTLREYYAGQVIGATPLPPNLTHTEAQWITRNAVAMADMLIDMLDNGLPEMEELEEFPSVYDGPIERGMDFVWEPDKPHAKRRIRVIDVRVFNGSEENRIWSVDIDDLSAPATWNEESRFREAVVPIGPEGQA